ncbi:probable crinkler effector protein 16 [Coccomyxa sp. Obi]|nr:probable crinkler effector protein 16 [Coccomyxa sp. Obi]
MDQRLLTCTSPYMQKMEDRLISLQQRLDRIRDLMEAELLKGPSRDKDLVESYKSAEERLMDEVKILESQGAKVTRDQGLSEFWSQLATVKIDNATRVMELPQLPKQLLAFMPPVERLYVRKCYDVLSDVVIAGEEKDILVTGTPGTGKSCWQFHLLQRLAGLGCTVVLDWANSDGVRVLFSPEGAFVGSRDSFKQQLLDPNNFFLVDGQLPVGAVARRVETTSPKHSLLHRFLKDGADERIMPPWTLEELEAAAPLFPNVSRAKMHELFDMWGGSVRWVLARANSPINEEYLVRAIDRTDLHALKLAADRSDAAKEVSNVLIHHIPNAQLRLSHVAMASRYVSDMVVKKLLKSYELELRNFLAASTGEGQLGVVRGNLFESFVHQVLPKGGKFTVRYLDSESEGEEEVVDVPSGEPCTFEDIKEVASLPDGCHCRPKSKVFQSVDFLRQPNDIGQVTQNLQHAPAQSARIREWFEVLRAGKETPPGPVYLTYVVPPEIFKNLKEIRLKGPLDKTKYPLRHRVMKMPFMRAGALAYRPIRFCG